ncbi:MAG: hypothetical protein JW963_19815 [Anaerolineales bacterium]|nr:hypothetical protein [Anaerolineales bacterium]
MSIVRKPDGTLVVGVRITLKPNRDDDLIALVLSAKKLAPAIREAMRSGVLHSPAYSPDADQEALNAIGIDL